MQESSSVESILSSSSSSSPHSLLSSSPASFSLAPSPRGPPNLRIDTSIITEKGGSKSILQAEKLRKQQRNAEREQKVRERQEREQGIQNQDSASMSAVNRGLGLVYENNNDTAHDSQQQQQQQQYYNGQHEDGEYAHDADENEDYYHDHQQGYHDSDQIALDDSDAQYHHHQQQHHLHHDEEESEEEEEEEDDDLSSSPSIPDEHIDFDLVYALHTFLATVEGQASVVKGDQLTLLDDSNSYWWLVRVLKTSAVGYIPAENIETPYERLARLNKHRNVDLTFATQEDMLTGTGSSLAQTRFAQPHHPTNKTLKANQARPPIQLNPALAGGGRFVDFAPPTYHEHEGFFYSDEDDEEGEDGEEYSDDEEEAGDHQEGFEGDEDASMDEDERDQELDAQSHLLGEQSGVRADAATANGYDGDQEITMSLTNPGGTPINRRGPTNGESDRVALGGLPQDDIRATVGPKIQTGGFDNLGSDAVDENRQHQQQNAQQVLEAKDYAYPQGNTNEGSLSNDSVGRVLQPQSLSRASQAQAQAALGVAGGQRPGDGYGSVSPKLQSAENFAHPAPTRKLSIDEQLRIERDRESSSSTTPTPLSNGLPVQGQRQRGRSTSSTSSGSATRVPSDILASNVETNNETRKISLTPKIARDDSVDSNLSSLTGHPAGSAGQGGMSERDRIVSPTPSSSSTSRQPFRNISNTSDNTGNVYHSSQYQQANQSAQEVLAAGVPAGMGPGRGCTPTPTDSSISDHYRRGSAASAHSAASHNSAASSVASTTGSQGGQKRGASPSNADPTAKDTGKEKEPKKKKSSGILGGLFSRSGKKDKEKSKKDRKSSGSTIASAISEDGRSTGTPSPAPESPERQLRQSVQGDTGRAGVHHGQKPAAVTAREEMFGTDAALRQQQVEAQNALYHNFGIHPRAPGDIVNTSTFSANSAVNNDVKASPVQSLSGSTLNRQHSGSNTSSSLLATPVLHQPHNLSPSSASMHSGYGSSLAPHGRSLRPGSLIGSPHMAGSGVPGAEVPILSVLRVFAGENVNSEATFKTVLLNDHTTTEDLVKQAMQRFRLSPPTGDNADTSSSTIDLIMSEYYLTAKEMSGDETILQVGDKPLRIFEDLSHASDDPRPGSSAMIPSVKRSSVGSITSIASNLSMNPAIEKLRMSDFSDDSNVKLFINKRTPEPLGRRSSTSSTTADKGVAAILGAKGKRRVSSNDGDTSRDSLRLSVAGSIVDHLSPHSGLPSSPLLRFALKVIIHPADLPDSMAFDPNSTAILPKANLYPERSPQQSRSSSASIPHTRREKIIFFPRNTNVSEVLETALDRFGIVEGVVDGGDEVEDKITKRRSISRVRYCLAATFVDRPEEEAILAPSSKLVDAYHHPPAYKQYERNSKEFRRRSMDAAFNAPSSTDLQPTDPTFIIRRATYRSVLVSGSIANTHHHNAGRNGNHLQPPPHQNAMEPAGTSFASGLSASPSSQSVYATPLTELPPELERTTSPQQTRQEIIAAQRAAQRANQTALISAQRSPQVGADGIPKNRADNRTSRDSSNTIRYSYIGVDGNEIDGDEVDEEWKDEERLKDSESRTSTRTPTLPRDSPSAMSHRTTDSYSSALTSPMTPAASLPPTRPYVPTEDADAEERVAIDSLASAPLSIDKNRDSADTHLDRRGAASPALSVSSRSTASESAVASGDGMFAKVKAGTAAAAGGLAVGIASVLRGHQTEEKESDPYMPSHNARNASDASSSYISQAQRARSSSNASVIASERGSPGRLGNAVRNTSARSTPQPDAPPTSESSTPRYAAKQEHHKQPSLASVASDASSSVRASSPSTPATASAGNTNITPVSSTRNDSSLSSSANRVPLTYRDDFGLDVLLHLVNMESGEVSIPKQRQLTALEALSPFEYPKVSPETESWYARPKQKISQLEERLDRLLDQVLKS